ncbi:UAA transporter [Hortaea werneckii]|nr:UAA transporter [Hortaea werneckii]
MPAANGSLRQRHPPPKGNLPEALSDGNTLAGKNDAAIKSDQEAQPQANTFRLVICVGGIYLSFLTWGILQERITTTNHGTPDRPEIFHYPVVMNTIQSLVATLLGYLYVLSIRTPTTPLRIFPTRSILPPLCLVALTSALASPFGYASLAHVDYITFILAKSCKLLPVMFLHVTLYGKRYPFYKYGVVALVTAGVALFTLSSKSSKKKSSSGGGSSAYGLMLLAINLLFDGLTNSTQDDIYARFRPYTGAQMMTALNLLSTGLTALYLLLSPYILPLLNLSAGTGTGTGADELSTALAFLHAHPQVLREVFGFALAGGVGQIFIFATLSHFGSLLLVTVTVTRKMLTMLLSVLWFGHRLTGWQWVGVGLVFGGVGVEGQIGKWEKAKKERERREAVGKGKGKGKGM